jgi:hypothetical protein
MTNATWEILSSWTEGGVTGKRSKVMEIRVTTTGDVVLGTALTAAEFGLTKIERCSNIYVYNISISDDFIYPAVPDLTGSNILVAGATLGALQEAVASVTIGTGHYIKFTIHGY